MTSKEGGKARRVIPIAAPSLPGNENAYVNDCLDSGWISSTGKYPALFENAWSEFCGARYAVACCNGTAALHLALLALGVRPGDEVIVPTLTFVATANAVTYCGAVPVFVDSEPRTWNLDPAQIEALITPRTRGIIAVHLYGHPADMDELRAIAARHGLFLLEDAAEAHGATYKGRRAGSLGDAATFSFYGNKIISTGEGGMVLSDNLELIEQVRLLRGQGLDPQRRYWFPVIGYNYRMTNIAAALGLAQTEKIDWQLARRREVASWYKEELEDFPAVRLQTVEPWAEHSYWMFNVLLEGEWRHSRDEVMARLSEQGIETRPVFYPLSMLPPYREATKPRSFPVAEEIARRGITLPTHAGLGREDVAYICDALKAAHRSS